MSAFLISPIFRYLVLPLLVAGLLGGVYFAWESRVERAAIIEAQRDQLAAAIRKRDQETADKNRIWAQLLELPDARQRICATRAPTDGCCTPQGECRP